MDRRDLCKLLVVEVVLAEVEAELVHRPALLDHHLALTVAAQRSHGLGAVVCRLRSEDVAAPVAQPHLQAVPLALLPVCGVSAENARLCVLSGANVLVAGSSVLGKPDIEAAARTLLAVAEGKM